MMKFLRYLSVQLFAYCLDMGTFLLLIHYYAFSPVLATMAGRIQGGWFAYLAHRYFTFNIVCAPTQQIRRYCLLFLLNIPLAAAMLSALLPLIPMPSIAKFLSDIFCVLMTYWANKTYVFVSPINDNNKHLQK